LRSPAEPINETEMRRIEERRSSRLIVRDAAERILLFRYAQWSGGTFWATPGGGVEIDETFEQAALREASEELGIKGNQADFLWVRNVSIPYRDHDVQQEERYFQMTVDSINLTQDSVKQEHKREGIIEGRWWTFAELSSTKETVFPEDIASRLSQI